MSTASPSSPPRATSRGEAWAEKVRHLSSSSWPSLIFLITIFVMVEVVLFFLCFIEYNMTRKGLIRHGLEPSSAWQLAFAISAMVFVMWTIILHLAQQTGKGFGRMAVAMTFLILLSYGGGGQWTLIEMSAVEATREASNNLKREVNAYLAPAAKPGEILRAIHGLLGRMRGTFESAQQEERSGKYTGKRGDGAAVQRFGNVAQAFKETETSVNHILTEWTSLNDQITEKVRTLSSDIEKGGVVSANGVEDTLQEVITKLSSFPFNALRPQIMATLATAQQATAASTPLPTTQTSSQSGQPAQAATIVTAPADTSTEVYRNLYNSIGTQVATATQNIEALLAQIEAFKLPPQPSLRVESVKSVIWNNPGTYLMEIVHSIALVVAPLIYACGPAQLVDAFAVRLGLRRREENLHPSPTPATAAATA